MAQGIYRLSWRHRYIRRVRRRALPAPVTGGASQSVTGTHVASSSSASLYTSTFAGTENPLSEGGLWATPGAWSALAKDSGAYADTSSDAARLTTAAAADQYVEITYDQDPGANSWVGVMTRLQPGSGSGYLAMARYFGEAPGSVILYKITDSGSLGFTLLDGKTANIGTAPRRLRLTSVGNTHTIDHNDLIDRIVIVDTSYPTGSVGIASAVFGGPTVKTQTFDGGNLGVVAVFPGEVAISAGGGDQAVGGAFVTSTSVVYSPQVVTPGAVTITGTTIASTAAVNAGAVTTLTFVSGATITPASVANAGTVTTTTFAIGATIASTTVVNPGRVAALVGGAHIASTAIVRTGSIAVNVTGATIASGSVVFAGSLSPVGAHIPSGAQLFPGTALPLGALAGATIASGSQPFAGSVTAGPVTVSGATIGSSAQTFAGSVLSVTTITGAHIASTAIPRAGSVTTTTAVLGATIIPGSVVNAGSVTTSTGSIGAHVPSTATLFPGSVLAVTAVSGAHVASNLVLYPGRVGVGTTVIGAVILSGATLTPGLVVPGAVTILGAHIPSSALVFPGHIAHSVALCAVEFPIDSDSLVA